MTAAVDSYGKQLCIPDIAMQHSLDGTRTSQNWKHPPAGMDKLNTRAVFPSSNRWDIPDLPACDLRPPVLVPYSSPAEIREAPAGAAVHFFLDDYRFETVWSHPQRGLARLASLGVALTPDFSMWRDMPLVMQQWQVYRNRWCGAWLLLHGIDVIPTVTWSTPSTYEFAFAGIPTGSTVAISTVGTRSRDAQKLLVAGCEAMADALQPSRVLVYGRAELVQHVFERVGAEVLRYPTRWG